MDAKYPVILLFHSKECDTTTLHDLFGSPTWINIDLAESSHHLLLRTIIERSRNREMQNTYLRNAHHRSGRKWLTELCVNGRQYRLNIVIHYDEFHRLSQCCLVNIDLIVIQRRHVWPLALFKHMNIPRDKVLSFTCDLIGFTHAGDFIELRFENEKESKARCIDRCSIILEDLMAATWHPCRMRSWCLDHADDFFDANDFFTTY